MNGFSTNEHKNINHTLAHYKPCYRNIKHTLKDVRTAKWPQSLLSSGAMEDTEWPLSK